LQLIFRIQIADNLGKAGWSWGCVSAIYSNERTIWIVDAHPDDGNRFIMHADGKLSAFVELERQVLTVTFYLESIQARIAPRGPGERCALPLKIH